MGLSLLSKCLSNDPNKFNFKITCKEVTISKIFFKPTYKLYYIGGHNIIIWGLFSSHVAQSASVRKLHTIKKQDDTVGFFQEEEIPVPYPGPISIKPYIPYHIYLYLQATLSITAFYWIVEKRTMSIISEN